MREIEVKARLTDAEAFLKKAEAKGILFGEPIEQLDVTFTNDTPHDDPSWTIFRIRQQGDKTILTMKYRASERSRDNHERETEVSEAKQIADMLERVGYTFDVQVRKTRRKAKYNGLEVCFDQVDQLGCFTEVESLAEDDADVDAIQAELWNLLKELGVAEEDRVHKGYDTLMRKHKGMDERYK